MENLDKLFQLYESGNLPLVLQLCQAEGIDKKWFVRQLYGKYVDKRTSTSKSYCFFYNNNATNYIDEIRFCIYYYTITNRYSFWYILKGVHFNQTYDTLDNILDKFLEIIENE